jgi:predicted secreted protein
VKIIRAFALAASAAALLASTPAAAETAAAAAPATGQKAADPNNEVVCEKQEITGSRLGTRRICLTRAKWAERRLQDRQEIEKAQTNRGMKGE